MSANETRPEENGAGSKNLVGTGSAPILSAAADAVAGDTDHGDAEHVVPDAVDLYGTYTVKRSRSTNRQLADLDAAILDVLRDEHPATLRGTYYRVVSAGAVEKTEQGYRQVGRQVLKLRRSGALPYSWITDGTRYVIRPDTWSSLRSMLHYASLSYRRALWYDQPVRVQIFTEKDALVGVISDVTEEWDVPLGVLRGYASESFAWKVAESLPANRVTYMYQLGDHDPSGVDAWRDFEKKVTTFVPDAPVHFERLAVLPEQIEQWRLPTRPTKRSDTRAGGFDGGSVEVDAIPPSVLRAIVKESIEQWIDPYQMELTRSVEAEERDVLTRMMGGVA